MQKIISVVKYAFAAIGIAMLIGAVFWCLSVRSFIAEAQRAEGTVVDLVQSRSSSSNSSSSSSTYRPVVQFRDARGAQIEFTSSSGSNPPSYSVGERVTVLYRASEPNRASIDGFFSLWGGPVIVGALGTVFLLVGGSMIVWIAAKQRRDEYLRSSGKPIETEFQAVDLNRAFNVNGRHPFRVTTQWLNPATNEVHLFHSNNLWFDPTQYLSGKRIIVYIEPNNPKRYYMDVSFLPRVAS